MVIAPAALPAIGAVGWGIRWPRGGNMGELTRTDFHVPLSQPQLIYEPQAGSGRRGCRTPPRVDAAMMTAGPLSSGPLKRGTVQRASKCIGGEGQGEKSACNDHDAQKYHGIGCGTTVLLVGLAAGLRALAMGMRGYVTA